MKTEEYPKHIPTGVYLAAVDSSNQAVAIIKRLNEELEHHKQIIKEMLELYVFDIKEDGEPKMPLNEMIQLIEKAKKLIE